MIAAQVVRSPSRHSSTAPGSMLLEKGSTDSPRRGKGMSQVQDASREQDLVGFSTRWIQHLSGKTVNLART